MYKSQLDLYTFFAKIYLVHIMCTDHHNGRRLALLAQKGEILVRESGVILMDNCSFQLLMLFLIILVLKQK